jgi:chromosome segregation ATPase
MDKKDLYIEKLNAQLKEWSASIDVLKARAEKATADLKISYSKQVDDLKAKRETARTKLNDLKTAGDDAWERMTASLEKSWSEIKAAFDKAKEP